MYGCYRVQWTEYERGWGQRPDGTQYFATEQQAKERNKESLKYPNSAPDVYSSPGTPQ